MTSASKLLGGAAGTSAAGVANPDTLIEGNFSIDVYNGTEAELTIDNSINLSGKGGLVWIKNRGIAFNHHLFDTERGVTKWLISNGTTAETTTAQTLKSFNNNGFTLGTDAGVNHDSDSVAWTFKKAPKFFDIISYSGNGGAQVLSHSLGGAVGLVLIKRTDSSGDWTVGHRSIYASSQLKLNSSAAGTSNATFGATWSDTTIQVEHNGNQYTDVNRSGGTYVAYIFADNSSEDAADRMIKCGSFTEASSGNTTTVDLGFEPQWLLLKSATNGDNWHIIDSMRGLTANSSSNSRELIANGSGAEGGGTYVQPTSTGFIAHPWAGGGGDTIIYMAIRAPMMADVTDATEVFALQYARAAQDGVKPEYRSGFPVDMRLTGYTGGGASSYPAIGSRLTGNKYMVTSSTAQEGAWSEQTWDFMNGFMNTNAGSTNTTLISYMWRRAKGFFDVVAYTGSTSSDTVVPHSLGVVPEMMWRKRRDSAQKWYVWHKDVSSNGYSGNIDITNGEGFPSDTAFHSAPTSTQITQGVNNTGNFIAYLFATLAGVSKVGSATHSGTTNVDAGFSNGCRFLLLKRTDATGDWLTYDSTRGIVSGNDPYLALNSAAAQVTNTDYIDPYSAGFTLTSSLTAGTYIYYAIA